MSKNKVLLAVCFLVACGLMYQSIFAQGKKDELTKLKGQWKVIKATLMGKDAPPEVLTMKLNFSDKEFTIRGGPKDVDFSFEIVAEKEPYRFEMTATTGNFKDKKGVGFYKWEKEKLHLYMPNRPNGEDPPKDLEDEKAKQLAHFVLEKVKQDKDQEKKTEKKN